VTAAGSITFIRFHFSTEINLRVITISLFLEKLFGFMTFPFRGYRRDLIITCKN